jgi:hypothetical protein
MSYIHIIVIQVNFSNTTDHFKAVASLVICSNSTNASQALTSLSTWRNWPMQPIFIYLFPTMYQNYTYYT